MRSVFFMITCFCCLSATGQSASFPQSWAGDWKGDLYWYKTGSMEPKKVNMELRIHAMDDRDSLNSWTWQIIYGAETEDNRPYKLVQKDTAGIHWAIDENNGIVLDQYWVGDKFSGAFTVQNSTIINSYWMEENKMGSYQKAILFRKQ